MELTSAGELRARIGLSPITRSLKLGALRTHVATAALLARRAEDYGVVPRLAVRLDDTNSQISRERYVRPLLQELAEVGRIPFRELGTTTDVDQLYRQSQHDPDYWRAIEELERQALVVRETDGTFLRAHECLRRFWEETASEGSSQPLPSRLRLTRADGSVLWHIASVASDISLGTDIVVRGSDKRGASELHRAIAWCLGARPPTIIHLPLVQSPTGQSQVIQHLERAGYTSDALFAYVSSSLSTSDLRACSFGDLVRAIRTRVDNRSMVELDFNRLKRFEAQSAKSRAGSDALAALRKMAVLNSDFRLLRDISVPAYCVLLDSFRRPLRTQYELSVRLAGRIFEPPNFSAAGLHYIAALRADQVEIESLVNSKELRWVLGGSVTGPHAQQLFRFHVACGTLVPQLAAAQVAARESR